MKQIPVLVSPKDLKKWMTVRKTTTTRARLLTQRDYEEMNGIIQTKEGPASFSPGDYLAEGVALERWPISAATMQSTKRRISEEDADGWATYENTDTTKAVRISRAFIIIRSTKEGKDKLTGKPNDYILYNGKRIWIVDSDIFSATYEIVTKE